MDESNNKSLLIKRQLQSYKKADPKTKHQKAIPPEVYQFILHRAKNPRGHTTAELLYGALFLQQEAVNIPNTKV